MSSDSDRLIDLTTSHLATNAELHLAAKAELRRRFDARPPAPEAVTAAVDALAKASSHPLRRHWKSVLYLSTLLVSLTMLAPALWQLRAVARISNLISPLMSMGEPDEPDITRLTTGQTLLLYGNPEALDASARWKPLWDSEPGNPAYLAQYAAAWFSDHKSLSPEILEAAARIDPENGWFLALAAAAPAESSIEKVKTPNTGNKDEILTPTWTIRDRRQLDHALALIHQAMEKPRFDSYEKELLQQRIPLLPKRHDWISQVPPIAYLASQTAPVIHLRKLADAMAAEAQECAKGRDREGFLKVIADWNRLAETCTESGLTLVDLLVAKVTFFGPAENFRDAAQGLGLEKEAARFTAIHDQKVADKKLRRQRGRNAEQDELIGRKGSLFSELTIPMIGRQVKSPPALTADDLTPGRYADHALLARVFTVAAWLILAICTGLALLHRVHQPLVFRRLSERTVDLLRPSDWLMIVAGAILFPLLWYLAITRLTPLSAREWSIRSSGFFQPACQFGSLLLMLVVFPLVIASSRLAKRATPFGLSPRFIFPGWLAGIAAALATPAAGAMMLWPGNLMFYLTFTLLAVASLWLLVGLLRNIFAPPPTALRRATLARCAIPPWTFGMLVLAASLPFQHAEERHWIQKDRLFEINAEAPAFSSYEWDITQLLRSDLLEMIHPTNMHR